MGWISLRTGFLKAEWNLIFFNFYSCKGILFSTLCYYQFDNDWKATKAHLWLKQHIKQSHFLILAHVLFPFFSHLAIGMSRGKGINVTGAILLIIWARFSHNLCIKIGSLSSLISTNLTLQLDAFKHVYPLNSHYMMPHWNPITSQGRDFFSK